ncbi:hypothetical protein Q5P01_000224 [Channa striata]|uniref:Uncharacterized protein n=1 Tax=Channa striata TaxID=64152 RepID=A0AA88LFA5_CHASR|nr:hypothetical protein Q5P01_000224 [Channa striata]
MSCQIVGCRGLAARAASWRARHPHPPARISAAARCEEENLVRGERHEDQAPSSSRDRSSDCDPGPGGAVLPGLCAEADRLLLIYCESTISVYTFPLGYSVTSQGVGHSEAIGLSGFLDRCGRQSEFSAARVKFHKAISINAKWATPWFRLTNPALRYAKPWRSSTRTRRRIEEFLDTWGYGFVASEVGGYYSSFGVLHLQQGRRRELGRAAGAAEAGANFKVEGLARGPARGEHGPIDTRGLSDSERKRWPPYPESLGTCKSEDNLGGESTGKALKMNPYR